MQFLTGLFSLVSIQAQLVGDLTNWYKTVFQTIMTGSYIYIFHTRMYGIQTSMYSFYAVFTLLEVIA